MADVAVLKVDELMKRWKLSESSIRNMVASGNLKTIQGIPGVRFSLKYIEDREAVGLDYDPLTPFERRKLEKERDYWKKRAEDFESILKKIRIDTAAVIR